MRHHSTRGATRHCVREGTATEARRSLTPPRFIFDNQLTGPGSALGHIYHTKTVKHTPGLGPKAADSVIFKWCREHGYVLVSKDWGIYTEPELAREVNGLGISIVWLYHRTGNMGVKDQFFVLARDLRFVEERLIASRGAPTFFALALRGGARIIPPPTGRSFRPGRPRKTKAVTS